MKFTGGGKIIAARVVHHNYICNKDKMVQKTTLQYELFKNEFQQWCQKPFAFNKWKKHAKTSVEMHLDISIRLKKSRGIIAHHCIFCQIYFYYF